MKQYVFLAFIFLPYLINASPLKVNIIPWVQSNIDIPHISINNLPTHLQAIAEDGDCISYSYRWDLNADGDFNDLNENTITTNKNLYFGTLHLEHTFSSVLGNTLLYPKIEVSCGTETISTTYPILIYTDRICPNYFIDSQNPNCSIDDNLELTRQIYTARALDNALWYLFRQAIHKANDSLNHNEHLCYIPGNQTLYSTGHTLNLFLRRGHGFGINKDQDPYFRHLTQCGIHSILSTMQLKTIGFLDTDILGTQGKGMEFIASNNLNAFFWASYESTAWAEPLANFGNSSYISPVGRDGIFNNNLKNIGQDIIDGLLHCTTSDGAWFYTCMNMTSFTDDASTNGWAPEAIRILKRKFQNIDYDSFKDKQRTWLSIHCPNGVCSYDGPGPKLAGNTLVGYGWTENENMNTNVQVSNSVNAIQSWYLNDPNHWGLYYIYATTKGLRSFTPEITYLPNGTHWSNEYIDFFITGKNKTKNSNGASKQLNNGTWTWAGNWPWAGSFSTNERTSVTAQIIQSWLEVQPYARATPQLISPNTEVIFDHSWSYVLDPEVTISEFKWNVIDDLTTEDINNNGKIDSDEIVWDFSTSNLTDTFAYTYNINVDWNETLKQKITLRTIDNLNRIVDDENSVSISISKFNHAPTPINEFITAYSGQNILLNVTKSFDVDSNQIPYENRPKDFISSIEYDQNLDGTFTSNNNFTVPSNLEKYSIPFKICDDGQWTNLCLDGIDKPDCSLCSYGSITVNILPNTLPPTIIEEQTNDLIDLTSSFDPENLNVSFQIELINGQGTIEEISKGIYLYHPIGDGFRIDTVKVTATDEAGLSSSKNLYIEVPNLPPIIESVSIEYFNLNPIVSSIKTNKLGNSFYEILIEAIPNPKLDISATAIVTDYDPFISTTFNNSITIDNPPYKTSFLRLDNIGQFSIVAFDGTDYSSTTLADYNLPKATSLSYTIDINNDGNYIEVFESSLNTYTFKANLNITPIKISVQDNLGLSTSITTNLDTENHSPVIEDVNLVQNDRQISVFINAFDLDNDSLQYVLNTGDGQELVNNTGIFIYTYTGFGIFNPSIRVFDSGGLQDSEDLESISFIENLPPTIQSLTALVGYAGSCWILLEANDPNNDNLSYTVKINEVTYNTLDFTLPYQNMPYIATVTVQDDAGLSTEQNVEIQVLDAPTNINIQKYDLQDNKKLVVVNATDFDTANLKYFWNINNMGYVEKSNVEVISSGSTVSLKVLDTWSNIETETTFNIEVDPLLVIDNIEVDIDVGGLVHLNIISNHLFLRYEIDWGDDIINNSLEHKYEWKETPYTIKVKGFTLFNESELFVKDIQVINHPIALEDIQVWQDDGIITLSVFAHDYDVDDLLFSFDFENDGILEYEQGWSNTERYEAQRSGLLSVKITMFDEWSKSTLETIKEINVDAWILSVDNVQSEEGRCVILSANDLENPKVNLENCNIESDPTSDYIWLLDNEEDKRGDEVSYLFEDDGIYTIKMLSPYGYYDKIRVHVSNVAPIFTSIPDIIAYAGKVYKYDIQVKDPGAFDKIEVKLGAGSPTDMTIQQIDEFLYRLEWLVPNNLVNTEASVNLIAKDFHGSDDHYYYDGGRTEQSFRIRVLGDTNLRDMSLVDMNVKDMDIKDAEMVVNMDYLIQDYKGPIMTTDNGIQKSNRFQGGDCNSVSNDLIPILLIIFIISGIIIKDSYRK